MYCAGCLFVKNAPVAQLDRVSDYESEGRRFDSCLARHFPSAQNHSLYTLPLACILDWQLRVNHDLR